MIITMFSHQIDIKNQFVSAFCQHPYKRIRGFLVPDLIPGTAALLARLSGRCCLTPTGFLIILRATING